MKNKQTINNLDRFKDRFKFRWFCNSTKFMYEVISLNIKDNYAVVRGSYADEYTPDEEVNISDGILMQCTGLKDKNGNLIYEGDIIKTSFVNCETGEPEEDDGNFSQIHFRDCCFCKVQNVGTKHEYAEHLFNEWGEEWDGSCYEVIGNIYENKDL